MAAVMSSGPLLPFGLCWMLLSTAHGISCPDKVEFTIAPGATCVYVDYQVNGESVAASGNWQTGDYLKPGRDCFPEGEYGFKHTRGDEECSVTVYVKGVCSWHPNHCWPGDCASNLASNCVCRSGFYKYTIYHSDGYYIKRCRWYSLPDLDTCRVAVTDSQGTSTNSTNSGPKTDCSSQRDEFIKTQPAHLFFVLKADFNKTFGDDDSPHVSETKIGIVGAHISVVKRPLVGSTTTIVEQNLQSPPLCKQSVSATNPVTGSDQHVCEATLTLPQSKVNLHDGDRVCAVMRADAGGYYKLKDYSGNYKGTETFPETHQSRTICFIMDQTKPAHCISTGGGDCASEQPMTLSTRVTRSRHLKVSINGWTDPGPSGYSWYTVLASGLAQFRLEVHEVHAGQNSLTVLPTAITALTQEWNASASSPGGPYEISLTLPGAGEEEEEEEGEEEERARMYGILLEVHDKVQNVAYARRLVLLDNSSSVEFRPATSLTVVHAEPKSNYKWQTDVSKELCVRWPGRFYNTDMVRNNLLKTVESDPSLDIHGHYDQITGTLPISGTDNVDGITKFEMAWSLNEGQRSEFTEVKDLHALSTCLRQPLHDGETYDMWIRASDIMGNSKEDSVRVSIDHTHPDVNVRGLLGRWNRDGLYVHNNTDLSKMTLVLRTADPHSGLSTIHWTLSTQPLSDDIGRGAVGVQRLDNTTSCTGQADCYCPSVGSCEADRYLVTFTNLVQHHTHQGDHHRHYHITVTVTNWASLSTTSSLKILLDESPPSTGTVWEGLTADPQEADGRAEMDFTSSPVVHVHWHGFQDKESGISLYRVVMAERCVTAREVDEAANATEVKQGSKAYFTFPAEGRYFFSVLAYNGALEPSQVACSDGVVYDTTPPTLRNVTITHARGGRTLGCTQLPPQTWLVNENLTRVALSNTTGCQAVCSGSSPALDVEHLPLSSTHVEELDVSEQYCQTLAKMSADSVMMLPSDYVKVTWQGHDEESQMEEFYIGIGTDVTTASSPDFLPFTSTEGHSSYHVRHVGLGQGDPFFLFLRVTSKAGLSSTLTLGPVLIDVTAPEVTQPLVAVIKEELLLVTWPKGVFVDPEQPWNVDLNVSFRIGHDDGFVTPFHTVTDSTRSTCQTHGVAECAYYPIRDLHAYDTDYGRSFFFQLHVINAAGYVTTVNTSSVRLPSHSPPSHAVVLDVLRMAVPEVATATEPSVTQVFTARSTSVHGSSGVSSPQGSSSTSTSSTPPHLTTVSLKTASIQDQYSDDVDAILKSEEVCVAWKGFYHEEEIEVEVGIGTKANHDDIIQFHSAKSQSPICLSLTSLPVNTKLFSVVKATSSGGTSVFSSDGFVMVPKTDPDNLIKVFTGKGCHENHVIGRGTIEQSSMSFSVSENSIPPLHAGDFLFIELSPFVPHVVFQNATLLQTTFTGYQLVADTPTITAVLPHPAAANTSLQIQHCQKDSPVVHLPNSRFTFAWETTGPSTSYVRYFMAEITDTTCLERTNTTGEYLFEKCSLHSQKVSAAARELSVYSENLDSNFLPDHTYVSSISPCFDDACLPPVTSEPSTYDNGHVTVQFQQGTIVDMDQHQMTVDVQASVVPESVSLQTCLYMWTISADRSGSVPLADWVVHDSPNCSNIQIQQPTAVRGRGRGTLYVCLTLLYPVRSPRPSCLKLRRSPTTHLHEPFHVIELSHSTFRETDLDPWMASQQLGSRLHDLYDLDLDFAPSDVLLSAVLTNSLNLSVTWFLLTSPRAPSSGDCAGDKECVTSKTAGGHVTFPRHLSKLQSGNIYYVCAAFVDDVDEPAAAGSQAVQQQFCGDGVVIDDNAPVGGSVAISSANNGYLAGDSHVLVTWSGFADVEIDIPLLQDSITLNYSVSLGTYPGAEDLAPFVPVGQRTSWTFRHLSFRSGITCVATVRAQDRAGHVTEVSSDQKIYDRTPPVIRHLAAGPITAEYFVPGHALPIHWTSVEDKESGVDRMEVGVAQPGSGDTVIDFQSCQGTSAVLTNTSGLVDGHHYVVLLKVSNKAGLTTVKSSAPFIVDSSPPSLGRLWHNDTDTTILGGYSTHVGVYSVRWSGFTDPHSGLDYYKVGLGSSAGQTDVVPFVYVGLQTTYTWKQALEQGIPYYATLQACNRAALCRVTSSSSLTFDDSPPTSGHVTVGLYGHHEKFLGHNSSVPVQWTGFSDPQTGIQHFTCCVGLAPRACDVIASTHILLSRAVHMTSPITLPPATPLYVTVTAVNPAGLETSSVSDSFVVDSTPPEVVSRPQFLSPRDGSPVSSQWDRSVLHVTWLYSDPESSVVSHTVYVRSQLSGRLVVDPIILGPETQLTLTLDQTSLLTDGDKHWASVSACNAAHLCVIATSDVILIDSTPPVTGTFQSPLTWKQELAQSEGDTLTVIDVRWSGFSDAESDMTGYEVIAGREYNGEELSGGRVSVPHNSTAPVQRHRLQITEQLRAGDVLHLAVLAGNTLHLRSPLVRSAFDCLQDSANRTSGTLELIRHSCDASYCTLECTCAAEGQVCRGSAEPCLELNSTEVELSGLQVLPMMGASLAAQNSSAPPLHVFIPDTKQTYLTSSKCLEGHWSWAQPQPLLNVSRFEYSFSLANMSAGEGVINTQTEPVWYDVGRAHMTALHCLPGNRTLTAGHRYVLHVRVWTSPDRHVTFTSSPVTHDPSPPRVKRGRAVLDSDSTCSHDVDYVTTERSEVTACWKGVFGDSQSLVVMYQLWMGTSPKASNHHAMTDAGLNTSWTFPTGPLEPGTRYYVTVRAWNGAGLQATAVSDGFLVDVVPPLPGVVFASGHRSNRHAQSSASAISASWHGFEDGQCGVRSYQVAVRDAGNSSVPDTFLDVGRKTRVRLTNLTLTHGHSYQVAVKATDAAGLESQVVESTAILVDVTPPEGVTCTQFQAAENVTLTPSFTPFHLEDSYRADWVLVAMETGEMMQVEVTAATSGADATLVGYLHAADLRMPLSFHPLPYQAGVSRTRHTFLSPYSGQVSLQVVVEGPARATLWAQLSRCQHTQPASSPQLALTLRQISPSTVSVCCHVRDQESGLQALMVGLGTTPGGLQVRPWTRVGYSGHLSLDVHEQQHATTLYAAVLAQNHAGQWSRFLSAPVVLDKTGPVVSEVTLTLRYGEGEGQGQVTTTVWAEGSWSAYDVESGVEGCSCRLDGQEVEGSTEQWTPGRSGTTTTNGHCQWTLSDPRHGSEVTVSVTCHNTAALRTIVTSLPVMILLLPPSLTEVTLDSLSNYVLMSPYDRSTPKVRSGNSSLQFFWRGVQDPTVMQYYFRFLFNTKALAEWSPLDVYKTTAVWGRMGGTSGNGDVTVELQAVNGRNVTSETLSLTVTLDDTKPLLTGKTATLSLNDGELSLDWRHVFDVTRDVTYSVYVGTEEGYGNVINHVTTALTHYQGYAADTSTTLYVIIQAVYDNGMSATYTDTLEL